MRLSVWGVVLVIKTHTMDILQWRHQYVFLLSFVLVTYVCGLDEQIHSILHIKREWDHSSDLLIVGLVYYTKLFTLITSIINEPIDKESSNANKQAYI